MEDDKYEDLDEEQDTDVDDNDATETIRIIKKDRKISAVDNEDEISDNEDTDEDEDAVDIDTDDDSENDDEDEEENDDENADGVGANSASNGARNAFMKIEDDDDADDEDEDANDENYLQKFDETIQRKIIEDFHPELKSHNYEEVDILARVVRDENGQVIDPLHKTLPFLTRYEKARIIGERAKQLNSGAIPTIEVEPDIIDGYLIALKEFEQKKIPFIIKRPLPNGGCEYWRFADLEIIA